MFSTAKVFFENDAKIRGRGRKEKEEEEFDPMATFRKPRWVPSVRYRFCLSHRFHDSPRGRQKLEKAEGKREKPATWRSFPSSLERRWGKQRRKLFHMRNCARTGFTGNFGPFLFRSLSLFSTPSSSQSSPIHFETRSLIRRVALILASSRASSNNLNCFLSVRFIFHRCIKTFPSLK